MSSANDQGPVNELELYARVAERSEQLADWDELERHAGADPDVWRRLAQTLRGDCALRQIGGELGEVAQRVPWPGGAARGAHPARARYWGLGGVRAAAVLLVGLALLATGLASGLHWRAAASHELSRVAASKAEDWDEAWAPLLVDAQPVASGEGVEVTFVQPVLRRAVVPALYELERDENDHPLARPIESAGLPAVTFL